MTRLSDSNKRLCGVNSVFNSTNIKEGRFSVAFLGRNLHTLFSDSYFRTFFYRESFIQIFEMFQSFLNFFHVNHEGIMNIDRTNTVFEVLLHYR